MPPKTAIALPTSETVPPPATPTPHAEPIVAAEPAPATTGAWTQLAGGPQRTGYAPVHLTAPFQFRWIWNGPIDGGDAGPAPDHLALPKGVQPIIGDGKVYVGHNDGIVRALQLSDGQVAWSSAVGGAVLGTAAYHSGLGRVFVGSTNGRVFSLDAVSGAIVNTFDAGGPIEMSPLLAGDTLYVGTVLNKGASEGEQTRGMLYALNAADLVERWRYDPGAGLIASPAYSGHQGGLIIVLAEDKSVHAVRLNNGSRFWRREINAGRDPQREWAAFPDTYPAVSEANGVVVVRSYFTWSRTWAPDADQTDSLADIRNFLTNNPEFQSFFVLDLATGQPRYVAPVLGGGIGNGDDYYSTPPQAVIRPIDGGEAAYVSWRSSLACLPQNSCDSREEGAIGEMNLADGSIRFIEIYKNRWQWRIPADEMGSLTMAGDTLFYSHWMAMAAVRITDRSAARGDSPDNPITTEKVVAVTNSLGPGMCEERDSANHYCPTNHYEFNSLECPTCGNVLDPAFYLYYAYEKVYDRFFTPPVFGPIIDPSGIVLWKSVDGAIIALAPASVTEPTPAPSANPIPNPEPQPTPSATAAPRRNPIFLPFISAL